MKRYFFITQTLLLVTVWILAFPFLACSKRRDAPPSPSADAAPTSSIRNTAGIVTGREVLNVIGSALNIDYSSNTAEPLLLDYRNFSASLPKYGDNGLGFNTVMSRLLTNFVAHGCRMAVNNEVNISKKEVFRFINIDEALNSTTNQKKDRWEAFTTHLAARFWGVIPQADELKFVNDFTESVKPLAEGAVNTNAQTRDVAVAVCTLIGSAPRAVFRDAN